MYQKYKLVIIIITCIIATFILGTIIYNSLKKKNNNSSNTSTQNIDQITVFNINTTKLSSEQKSEVTKIRDSIISSTDKLNKQVFDAKMNAGENNLLNINRIAQDKNMQETKIILSGIREAIIRYQENITKLMLDLKQKIELGFLDSNAKKWILIGMNSGHNYYQATTKGDLLVLDQAEAAIKILTDNIDKWSVDNGNISFKDAQLQKDFAEKFAMITKIKQEQAALINQYNQGYQIMLNSLTTSK